MSPVHAGRARSGERFQRGTAVGQARSVSLRPFLRLGGRTTPSFIRFEAEADQPSFRSDTRCCVALGRARMFPLLATAHPAHRFQTRLWGERLTVTNLIAAFCRNLLIAVARGVGSLMVDLRSMLLSQVLR